MGAHGAAGPRGTARALGWGAGEAGRGGAAPPAGGRGRGRGHADPGVGGAARGGAVRAAGPRLPSLPSLHKVACESGGGCGCGEGET